MSELQHFDFPAYLDITENVARKMQEMRDNKFQLQPASFFNTFAVGYESVGSFVQDVTTSVDKTFDEVPEEDRKSVASSKLRLLIGAAIVNDIRKAVKDETQYECSAGIAHNKILAKLTCGMNKPNKQTILPIESISGLFQDLAVSKVKSLGGKLGEEVCAKLNVKTMADLLNFSENELQSHFQGRVGSWLYFMARGIDLESVTPKFMSKSIAVSKNFRGKNEIASMHTLKFWLKELAKEIVERLEKDEADCKRLAKQLIVSFTQGSVLPANKDVSSSRTVSLNGNSLNSYTAEQIADEAFETIKRNTAKFLKSEGTVLMNHSIKHLGISAGKFEEIAAPETSNSLQNLLKNHHKKEVVKPQTETKEEPTVQFIKKFEMKSPKIMTKPPPAEKVDSNELSHEASTSSVVIPNEAEKENLSESLKTSESFDGDHSIEGIETLRNWIAELLTKLCNKLTSDCESHQRAPSEIVIKYKQQIDHDTKVKTFAIPLDSFVDGVIDVGFIIQLMIGSEGFLRSDGTKRFQHPINHLQIVPTKFERNKKWCFGMKNLVSLPVLSDDESPAEVEIEDHQLTDEEFLRNELNEVSRDEPPKEFTELAQNVSLEIEDESRDYDIEESAEFNNVTNVTEALRNDQNETVTAEEPGPSYLNTYAEFQPPNIALEVLNPKESCIVCFKMIGKLDMISHLDHHLAFQLASQQREEYRQKNKPSQCLSSQSSVKKKTKAKIKPKLNFIEKYGFKKNDPPLDESTDDKIKCEQCQKNITTEEYVCHLDYHYAQKLRAEEMKITPQKVDLKRKRPGSTQKNRPISKNMKTYFTAN